MEHTSALIGLFKKHLGARKLIIFDIGARGGLHPRWSHIFPVIDLIGFEPDKAECERLNESKSSLPYSARFFPYALGRKTDQDLKFYVCRKPGCSSTYEPNSKFVGQFASALSMEVQAINTLNTMTLSDISLKEQLQPDFVKIDVQGAELDILLGGVEVLAKTKFIELEVEFNPQYIDQPLFHDVDKLMYNQGWSLLGLRRTYWRRTNGLDVCAAGYGGHLVHGDAIYFNSRFLERTDVDITGLLKFALILSAYRQNDYLISLLRSKHPALEVLSDHDRTLMERELVHYPSKAIQLLRWALRGINHRIKRRVIDMLQDGDAIDWHDPDFF